MTSVDPGAGAILLILAGVVLYFLFPSPAGAAFRLDFAAPHKMTEIPYASLFDKWSTYFDVPWKLMAAIVRVESNFNPQARNEEASADARYNRDVASVGLGQILYPDTAHRLDASLTAIELEDPDTNLRLVGMLLQDLLHRYPWKDDDDFPAHAVSAYNAGAPRLDPDRTNNLDYVRKVKAAWSGYV